MTKVLVVLSSFRVKDMNDIILSERKERNYLIFSLSKRNFCFCFSHILSRLLFSLSSGPFLAFRTSLFLGNAKTAPVQWRSFAHLHLHDIPTFCRLAHDLCGPLQRPSSKSAKTKKRRKIQHQTHNPKSCTGPRETTISRLRLHRL